PKAGAVTVHYGLGWSILDKSHSLTSPDWGEIPTPAASALPSGEKAMDISRPVGTERVANSFRVVVSQSLTVRPWLPVASTLPSAANATPLTMPFPISRVSTCCRLATFHNFTFPSQLPEARIVPSGEKATQLTNPVWPLSAANSFPVSGSHSRTD